METYQILLYGMQAELPVDQGKTATLLFLLNIFLFSICLSINIYIFPRDASILMKFWQIKLFSDPAF